MKQTEIKETYKDRLEGLLKREDSEVLLKEYKFMYSRGWKFDYAFPQLKIAIEYDGIVYKPSQQRGGHQTPKGIINDQEKRNEAQVRGWIVLLANQTSIDNRTFIDQLERAIKVRRGDIRYE